MMNKILVISLALCLVTLASFEKTKEQKRDLLGFQVELETVRIGFRANDSMWTQAYVGAILADTAAIKVTMSKLREVVDNYGKIYAATSYDFGKIWNAPEIIAQRTSLNDSIDQALSDMYPAWHAKTGRLLATGKLFLYDTRNEEDPEIGRRAGYIIYNPEEENWSNLKTLEMPEQDHTNAPIINPTLGCIQRYDMPDGDILLPLNYVREVIEEEEHNVTTVVHCSFYGEKLIYKQYGNEFTIDSGRGLYEPSITKYKNGYFLTLRADGLAYVTRSKDGLQYQPIKKWTFDDGSDLGSYNTQQHWVTHSDGLFLVYTRRGADNEDIFRHRAPLFIAQVDPENLSVIRKTEKILIPKRGARLGNFGIADVNQDPTVVSAAERSSNTEIPEEFDNTVYIARI